MHHRPGNISIKDIIVIIGKNLNMNYQADDALVSV